MGSTFGRTSPSDAACADGSKAFLKAYKAGKDDLTATFEAALAYINQYKKGGNVAADSPCLNAAKVYAGTVRSQTNPSVASAMTAFMDEAILVGGSGRPDPVCLAAAETFMTAYLDGQPEAKAMSAAGVAFLDAVARTPS